MPRLLLNVAIRPASLLKQLRDLLVGIALLGADFATGSIARCSCWKLVSLLKRLLAGDALVSPLGRLLAVLPELYLKPALLLWRLLASLPRRFLVAPPGAIARCFAQSDCSFAGWSGCSFAMDRRLVMRDSSSGGAYVPPWIGDQSLP
ncbi:hypothetical protein CDL15_Pgr011288 [Punica granatum]|uniref:Uncharacterized protein n=1 Tax=Punica granatum TaxID=22663 RepID=A0A218WG09_PUNGR|nr:hypothetical protein CDL15_Pgr011288 [Punica granatum]